MDKIVRHSFKVVKLEDYKEFQTRNNYIAWGEKNDYPQKLVKLFNESAKHGAIVTGKASYIVGQKIKTGSAGEKFLQKANPIEDVAKFLKKLALDLELFGGYCYLVVPNLTKERAAAYYHIDLSKVRTNEDYSCFWVYPEWEKIGVGKPKEEKLKTYKAFDGVYDEPKIVFYSEYRPAMGVYPQPEYRQGLTAIETDARVNNFHLNNLRNGFFGSKIISVNGTYSPEQQDEFEASVKEKFTSDENSGEVLIVFKDGEQKAVDVQDLTAGDFGEQFSQLRKDTEQEIFIAHKVPSPMLFGVRVEGQLGGRNEILEAWELFDKTYIEQKRVHFETVITDLAEMKGVQDTFEIVGFQPLQKLASESVMLEVLTKDEIREDLGRAPMQTKVAETTQAQFSADKNDVEVFTKYGFSKDKVKRLSYSQVKYRSLHDMDDFHLSFATLAEGEGVNENEKKILQSLNNGKQPNVSDRELKILREKKLVEVDRVSGAMKLTQLGGLVLADLQPESKLAKLKTVYEYVKRPDARGPEILPNGRTRPFCEALIKADKFYSREDINSISAELGYDVWTSRGGWLTLPNGNHRPSCRHIWQAVLIEE